MNKYKKTTIVIYIAIILVTLFIFFLTYAYITVKIINKNKDDNIVFKSDTNIVFEDTSNLTLINAKQGDHFYKTFSVENTSNDIIYYDIALKNVVNSFDEEDELVYTLNSDYGAFRLGSMMPNNDILIASNVRLNKKSKHNYNMEINVLKLDDNQKINKTFSSSISIIPSKINIGKEIFDDNTLGGLFLKNLISSANNIQGNGVYYTNSSINGNTIYFYKGNNDLKNNIIFSGSCYKILRTTDDDNVRVIYNGKYENNECSKKVILHDLSAFNIKSNYNAYVGYMYGDASSDNYNSEHSNNNSSEIKTKLESWFKSELLNNKNISSTSIYCNNRKTNSFRKNGILYSSFGYGNNNTGYYDNSKSTYECINVSDRLSTNANNASNVLTYPVGLITVDELKYASDDKEDSFLYTTDSYWTMTPAYYNVNGAYNYSINNGKLVESKVDSVLGIRPVITLNKNLKIISGDGSQESPFKFE